MSNPTVRIDARTHRVLKELANESGESMQAVLQRVIEEERRRRFVEAANADYAALQAHPAAWAELEAERKLWDTTLLDGLEASGGVVEE